MRWTMDDIEWDRFDPACVDGELVKAVKAAALVEFNAPDYVSYLCGVFKEDETLKAAIVQWGKEEAQHGRALARWARLADPRFDFDKAFKEFRAIQNIDTDAAISRRGSRAGELISRCVVESGTSTFYTAIKDATDEPVLRQIAANIAADEFAHYKLFYDSFKAYEAELPRVWQKLAIALGRVGEADDEELSGAYYCANHGAGSGLEFDCKTFANAYEKRALKVYRKPHIARLIAMIAKASGLKPRGWIAKFGSVVAWRYVSFKQRRLAASAI